MGRVTARRRATRLTADTATKRAETLAVEEPLEIRLNGTPLTVTMRTPGADVELAQGFLLTEGVIGDRDDVAAARYCSSGGADGSGLLQNTYNVLDVKLAPHVPPPSVDVTRNFYARRMFMGAQGLGPLGLMEGDPLLIQAEQKLIDQADELVVLVGGLGALGHPAVDPAEPLAGDDVRVHADFAAAEAALADGSARAVRPYQDGFPYIPIGTPGRYENAGPFYTIQYTATGEPWPAHFWLTNGGIKGRDIQ